MILLRSKRLRMELHNEVEKELYEDCYGSIYSMCSHQLNYAKNPLQGIPESRYKEIFFHAFFKHGLNRKLVDILKMQESTQTKDYEKAGKELFDYLYDIADEVCEEGFLKDKNIEDSKTKSKAKRPKYSK